MKTTKNLLLLLVLFFVNINYAQKVTTVEAIMNDRYSFNEEPVEVKGTVIQYVYNSASTSYYLLKGDFGGIIKVNTADVAPETYKKYSVIGIVYLERGNNEPFISEKSKRQIESTADPDGPKPPMPSSSPFMQFLIDYYIIIGLGVLLIILIVVLVIINKKRSTSSQTTFDYSAGMDKSTELSQEAVPTFSGDDDFKTIRIATSSPKTLKFIPGELVITDGEDKGKSFKIAGYPTAEGSIVSIGREEIKGDRAYSHIQLKQKTVGRKQAELIHKDGKLFIKNLGEVNLTQVDGVELNPGEKVEIKSGSAIRTGEVEFQYKV